MDNEITRQVAIQYVPFLLFIGFWLLAGFVLIFRPAVVCLSRKDWMPITTATKGVRFIGITMVLFQIAALLFLFSGTSPWERVRLMKRVLLATADDIDRVEIMSWGFPDKKSIPRKPLIIRDKNHLTQLCNCMKTAESWNLGGISPTWVCKLKMHRGGTSLVCRVEGNDKGMVLLTICDGDSGGLSIGNPVGRFRCDSLGHLIKSWSNEAPPEEERK